MNDLMGRPDKRRDRIVVHCLLSGIEQGLTYKLAATRAGITERTLYRWMKQGEEAEAGSLATDFCHALKRANALSAHRALVKVQEGKRGWRSSAWFLERRFREHYGRTQ
jgi:transposase